jgi:predicted metallopeptidase
MLDYTALLTDLIADIAARVPAFARVDPARILISFAQTRRPGMEGLHARLVALRFEGGARTRREGGREWRMPELRVDGREMLYIVFVLLPRFCDLPLEEKLTTIFHELYHISPAFDGDVRRFPGRNWQHGSSRKAYDERVRAWARSYLESGVPPRCLEPLRLDFAELQERYGQVGGMRVRRPRPFPQDGMSRC